MPEIPFQKAQGLGNDFLIIDFRSGKTAAPHLDLISNPKVVRGLCDRHFGVGGDGILAITDGDSGNPEMRVLNADGSVAEMCGNGIRCVARYLFENDEALHKSPIKVQTGAGILSCDLETDGDKQLSITVDMGAPKYDSQAIKESIKVQGHSFLFTAVSMGNPHAVIFIEDPKADLRELAEKFGGDLEKHSRFPNRSNIEFARLRESQDPQAIPEIDLLVWERACGITLACGTGACATAVAACIEGKIEAGRKIKVNLPGGSLIIAPKLDRSVSVSPLSPSVFESVSMRGPAIPVFSATLMQRDLAAFLK